MMNKFLLHLVTITFILMSCSDNENEQVSYNPTSQDYEIFAKRFVDMSMKMEIDENIIFLNYEHFNNELEKGRIFGNEKTDYLTFSSVFEKYFGISEKATQEYLFLIAENQKLLKNKGSKEILVKYIQKEIENRPPIKPRFVFNTLYEMFGDDGNCAVGVLAAFLDTALSGVGIVVTAPTGAGAVISGVAFASSYATLVYRTAKCIK